MTTVNLDRLALPPDLLDRLERRFGAERVPDEVIRGLSLHADGLRPTDLGKELAARLMLRAFGEERPVQDLLREAVQAYLRMDKPVPPDGLHPVWFRDDDFRTISAAADADAMDMPAWLVRAARTVLRLREEGAILIHSGGELSAAIGHAAAAAGENEAEWCRRVLRMMAAPTDVPPPHADDTAEIPLPLPESLAKDIDFLAAAKGVTVQAWIAAALEAAVRATDVERLLDEETEDRRPQPCNTKPGCCMNGAGDLLPVPMERADLERFHARAEARGAATAVWALDALREAAKREEHAARIGKKTEPAALPFVGEPAPPTVVQITASTGGSVVLGKPPVAADRETERRAGVLQLLSTVLPWFSRDLEAAVGAAESLWDRVERGPAAPPPETPAETPEAPPEDEPACHGPSNVELAC